MATNSGKGSRTGSVKSRTQMKGKNDHWVKRDADTGKILGTKTSDKTPYKGVAKESDGRRS